METTVWTEPQQGYHPLTEDASCDVCIVGAGIAGLSTAYQLASEGRSVVVLDDGPIGGGESGHTTAHLTAVLDDRYYNLASLHGAQNARLAADSHLAAIDRIETIVQKEQIECDFGRLDGYLFAPSDDSLDELNRELHAARDAGLNVEEVERAPIPQWDSRPCLRFPHQAQFHPIRYLEGLARAIVRMGGRIHCGTHAVSVSGSSPAHLSTSTGTCVRAGAVVMATNSPVWDSYGLFTAESGYRTYVIGARVEPGAVHPALYWDTPDPYHYARLASPEILIVGGEDHKTGQADDGKARFERLEAWTRERFPIGEVTYRWSGQVLEPVDGLAFIGRYPLSASPLYVCTGDSGNGMTHGAIAGVLLADLIQGRRNPWESLYDPSRITVGALPEYANENINVAAQYGDYLTEPDIDSLDQLAPGSGATIGRAAAKSAVYRDPEGAYHECSAICPHLGCIVSWNDAAKSWDCPCHGSRFDAYGRVVNGPANRDLAPANSYAPFLTATGVALRTATLLSANVARKLLGFDFRTGR
jgi:glycine/D-amino acid oxidase-like deaminating enzyme/nitrite reductase/ring-hydroxylating ferredoxin subunit